MASDPERPLAMTEAEIQVLMTDGRVGLFRPIDPPPYLDSSSGEPMWGHKDLPGLFAEHVFAACFIKLCECPYGKPGEPIWAGRFAAQITAITVQWHHDKWQWVLWLRKADQPR